MLKTEVLFIASEISATHTSKRDAVVLIFFRESRKDFQKQRLDFFYRCPNQ